MTRFPILLFLWLPFATAGHSTYKPCELCIDRATPTELAAIELRLYTGTTLNDYTSVRVGDALKLMKKIDKSKPTAVYISGWLSSPDHTPTKTLSSAYIARGDHNVILLDWHKIAAQFFTYSLSSVEGVAFTLAKALNELVSAGLSTSGMNIIGHSLGAHIGGYTGRYVNFRLPRITGLDPAGVGFYGVAERLSSTDAEFVAVIHSDVFLYGINLSIGDADFYPNGGLRPQPGCPVLGARPFDVDDFCSHYRACYFYAESVRNEEAFPSLKCESYSKFKNGSCLSNEKVVMGYGTPSTAKGDFYLQTKNGTLYDRGENGLLYKPSGYLKNEIL